MPCKKETILRSLIRKQKDRVQKVHNNLSALVFGAIDFTPSDLLDPAVAFASVTGCVIECNYIFRFVYECSVFTCVQICACCGGCSGKYSGHRLFSS